MKLALFGHDLADQENLRMVAKVAHGDGGYTGYGRNDVIMISGNKDLTPKRLEGLRSWEPDAVLTGMASTEPHGDLAMGEFAKEIGKPWVVLANTWRSGFRRAAQSSVGDAVLLTASNEEVPRAKEFGYKDAQFFGGPPKWQMIATEPQVDIREQRGVPSDEKVLLISGGKNHMVTTEMLEEVAMSTMEILGDKFKIIFKPHPKESEDRDDARRAATLGVLHQRNLITTDTHQSALMDSADCVIASPGCSATTEAIYRRRPNIWWENPKAIERFAKMADSDTWPPLDAEATLRAGTPVGGRLLDTRTAIELALSPSGAAAMKEAQERAFPVVAPQEIEKRIIAFLRSLQRE